MQALKDAGLTASQIDEVILVGGSTRIPAIQDKVKQIFGKEPNKGVRSRRGCGCRSGYPGRRPQR